jgi:hypothetical protein
VASGIGAINVTVGCVPQPTKTCAWNSAQADSVSVTVSYTYRTFFPLLFGTTIPMASTVQMVLE